MNSLQTIIEQAWENRALQEETTTKAIREVIELLDAGKLQLLNQKDAWQVNEWVKKVVMYFPIQKMETWEAGIFEYHDKMELKKTMLLKEFV
jgi:2,3,4,5-tetrahydropyridine-2-carboxylate N-succinyltransferase